MTEKLRWGYATAAAFTDALHADGDDSEADAVDAADERARQVVALKERVATTAMAWRRTLTVLPSTAYDGAFGVFVRATDAAIAATAPADPMATLIMAAKNVGRLAGQRGMNLRNAPDQEFGGALADMWNAIAAMERTP